MPVGSAFFCVLNSSKFGGLRFHTDHRATGNEDFIVFIIEVFEEMLCLQS